MAQSPRFRRASKRRPVKKQFLLDQLSVQDIEGWARVFERLLAFHWDFYSALAYQRSRIADDLRQALLEAAVRDFKFSRWQRVVRYKRALEPFSVKGSLVDPAGGRFNIGDINPTQFAPFPALYIASDKGTALQETLSQSIPSGGEEQALDFALARPDSMLNVSLSGVIGSVVDLAQPDRLSKWVDLIKSFSVPEYLNKVAQQLRIAPPDVVRTIPRLLNTLLEPNWRVWPMQYDVPAPSQIFGQMVAQAGIEAIAYPSKFTKKLCLAVFPQNLEDSAGFIELDDSAPEGVEIRKLDASNWRKITYPLDYCGAD
jgi:RES domain-containing protein